MPRFKQLTAELDGRFWKITENKNSFEWLKLQSGFKQFIPFKKTVVWNKWTDKGFRLSNSMRLTIKNDKLFVDFIFEKDKPQPKTHGNLEGIDLGYVDLVHCSDGQVVGEKINDFIKQFDKREKHTYEHVKQKAFYELKKLDMSNTNILVLEKLRSVKSDTRGMFSRKYNRRRSHWLYAKTTQWLEQHCEEQGIGIKYVSPYKTSQYCRLCGNWDRRNRKGGIFECVRCGHIENADSNASQNIKLLGLAGVYSLRSLPSNFIGEVNKCL
jgi:IS605 OrfB family transposase